MDDNTHSRAERFLSAFNQVEELLQRLAGGSGHAPFITLLDIMARRNPTVRTYYADLTQYARLRNIMVHTMREGYYMAEPHEQAVVLLESIVKQLSHPPIVADFMTQRPFSVRTTDPLSVVVEAFRQYGFMRCPVLDEKGIVGLITAKSFTRWLAVAGSEEEGKYLSLQGALTQPVSVFLEFCAPDEYAIVPRGYTLPDVMQMFQDGVERGKYLQCILVTASGGAQSPLVGIIAPSDLPKLVLTSEGR